MPIYEYRCEKCGVFEETQRITDPALDKCPTCRRKVRRLISNTSFQLKGGGWYVTDYARSGKGGKSGDKTGDKSGDTSSDKTGDKASSKDSSPASESTSSKSDKGSTSKPADTKGASSTA